MGGPHQGVEEYYSRILARHGPTAPGVDWQSTASQYLRFVQLLKICDFAAPFSLNDFGCGYGALLDYLAGRHPGLELCYRGTDISPGMIEAARSRWHGRPRAEFRVGFRCGQKSDYSLASGVFNVRLGWPFDEWEAYVASILRDLRSNSRRGFAVNFLLPLDDQPSETGLYRTSPEPWLAFCRREFDLRAEVLADYGLREFTLLLRN